MSANYAGDVSPREAWNILSSDEKAVLSPAVSFRRWLDQLLCYVLLDWPDIFSLDSVALYLGWQGLSSRQVTA